MQTIVCIPFDINNETEKSMKRVVLYLGAALPFSAVAIADSTLQSNFPSIPADYSELHTAKLISDAKPSFNDYYINKTSGYKVTAPSGAQFVVNSITQPKCAFYATYVSTDENGYLNAGTGNNPAVVSNVYVGEVNFDKCQ
jgi:hypothetical protein